MYRKSFEVVGYTADADMLCEACAENAYGIPDEETVDGEGNIVYPIFLDNLEGGEECGKCFTAID